MRAVKRALLPAVLALAACRKPAPASETLVISLTPPGDTAAVAIEERVRDVAGAKVSVEAGAIRVTLPGQTDEATWRARLTREGRLAFGAIDPRAVVVRALARAEQNGEGTPSVVVTEDGSIEGPDRDAIVEAARMAAPAAKDETLAFERGEAPFRMWVVEEPRESRVHGIQVAQDAAGLWGVNVTLDAPALFEALTRKQLGRRIAILVDGEVISAPVVMDPIASGRIAIPARDEREARELAAILAAPLPYALAVTGRP